MSERPISPLLEYDATRRAFIEPTDVRAEVDVPRACVLSWFHDAVAPLVTLLGGHQVFEKRWEAGLQRFLDALHPTMLEVSWEAAPHLTGATA